VLWRPLPYPQSDRIVSIGEQRVRESRAHGPVAPADFFDWRRESRSFAAMAMIDEPRMNLSGGGEPEQLSAITASPGFLSVLGVAPAIGRDMRADEEIAGKERVVLLGDGFWRRRFGADRAIVGRSITLNDRPYSVIGVLPASFWWTTRADVVIPFAAFDSVTSNRGLHYVRVVARLAPGVTPARAQAELDSIGSALGERYPSENAGHMPHAVRLQDELVRGVRPALLVLLGAVGLVLLIACANVATLLLARATGRQREIGVRVALGAARGRLVRQMLTESLLLALAGGAAGVLIASWSLTAFQALLPTEFTSLPGIAAARIDERVLSVALIVATATGLAFGVAPAFAASDVRPGAALSDHTRGGGSGARSWRMRAALVVAEMALSLVLLVGAGLLIVSFKHLLDVPPGFAPDQLIAAATTLPATKYDTHARITGFYEAMLERVRAMPGVVNAGAVAGLPFGGQDARTAVQIEGRVPPPGERTRAHPRLVSAAYLQTLGVPVVRGRALTERDAAGAPNVVLINTAAARRYWANEDPIGRRIAFGSDRDPIWLEIVGVAGDVKFDGLDAEVEPEVYVPYLQPVLTSLARGMGLTLVVRTSADAASLAPMLRTAAAAIDRNQPIGAVRPMERLIADSVAPRRLNLWLVSAFAGLALALTAAGLYGVMAYLVAQRTHEIGVRMALGASRARVLAMMLRQVGTLTAIGIAVGLAAALVLTRWLASLLFGVSARDPLVYAGVSAVLALVALAAVAIPTARAARVDPLLALREP
jgi:putative ABC transport system permease protein